jgi:hypothetical protein
MTKDRAQKQWQKMKATQTKNFFIPLWATISVDTGRANPDLMAPEVSKKSDSPPSS